MSLLIGLLFECCGLGIVMCCLLCAMYVYAVCAVCVCAHLQLSPGTFCLHLIYYICFALFSLDFAEPSGLLVSLISIRTRTVHTFSPILSIRYLILHIQFKMLRIHYM